MTPLFEQYSMGGAQVQLRKIAVYLGELGNVVNVFCTKHPRHSSNIFYWHDNVKIRPILRFKQPYPEPYATSIFNIGNAIELVQDEISVSDSFYCHDGGILFPFVYDNIPAIFSLRSVTFAETLVSGYLFQGDKLIFPSNYARACYVSTAGRFHEGYADRSTTIYNGLDFSKFNQRRSPRIFDQLGLDKEKKYLLFPHRPEAEKGIYEAIEILARLVNQFQHKDVSMLVPKWTENNISPETQTFYYQMNTRITEYGIQNHVIFHDWITDDLMPDYYSIGAVTLSVGQYVETFGNVPYESLACGTPAVVTRVGPAREILPDNLMFKIDPGDINEATDIIKHILDSGEKTSDDCLAYLRENFDVRDMVQSYAEAITTTKKLSPMNSMPHNFAGDSFYILPAWCFISSKGIYNDFLATYNTEERYNNLIRNFPKGFRITDAEKVSLGEREIESLYSDGYLIKKN